MPIVKRRVGAYDHVFRSSILPKLLEVPGLRPLLPFVRSIYARPSRYVWQDDVGQRHEVHQHEGGEQGDPLMPLVFRLAIQNALAVVKREMRVGEELCLLGRRENLVVPSQGTVLVQLGWRKTLLSMSGIQIHTGNKVLESHGTASTRHGGAGPRGVEPRRDQGSRNAVGLSGIRAGGDQSEAPGRTQAVGGHPVDT